MVITRSLAKSRLLVVEEVGRLPVLAMAGLVELTEQPHREQEQLDRERTEVLVLMQG